MNFFNRNHGIVNYLAKKISSDWVTPSYFPTLFRSLFRFFEVLILGEPTSGFKLNLITCLKKKNYDMLMFSYDPL